LREVYQAAGGVAPLKGGEKGVGFSRRNIEREGEETGERGAS
jgi:hypothetical protein